MKYFTLFTVLALICTANVWAAADDGDNDNDIDIQRLLGVRPDLAEDLAQGDGAQESGKVDIASEQAGCISECKETDQSCRARCLGVPGVASRKMPRKQDISGNLPLNWRKSDTSASARLLPRVWWAIGGVSVACLF
ncbi:hypothetical protein IWW55_003595 [Coemansia sp. RSA 2706]|nr:hypothetical protein IWW55_003595 [Coemansia sp. RSA 2706]KAJ2392179.1 hypothetical protein H4S02_000926 [Coemansia sp. RSA 2611]